MKLRLSFRQEAWVRLLCDEQLRFEGRGPGGFQQEWAAMKAEREGMQNPLLNPTGPAISVAELGRRGFKGTFDALVGYKNELFGKAAAVEANPDSDLSAGEATSAVIDGSRTDAPVIRVAGCRNKRDTLDGSSGDRVLKSPNGC